MCKHIITIKYIGFIILYTLCKMLKKLLYFYSLLSERYTWKFT